MAIYVFHKILYFYIIFSSVANPLSFKSLAILLPDMYLSLIYVVQIFAYMRVHATEKLGIRNFPLPFFLIGSFCHPCLSEGTSTLRVAQPNW